jgi:hypothetical protein
MTAVCDAVRFVGEGIPSDRSRMRPARRVQNVTSDLEVRTGRPAGRVPSTLTVLVVG